MAETLLSQLTSTIQPSTISQIAARLGVPERSVFRGLELSTATVFTGLANKSGDRGVMQQVVDVASRTPVDAVETGVRTGQLADSASSLMTSARSVLSSLFGANSNWAVDLIGHEAGLGAGPTTAMMVLGAHSLFSYFGPRVRDGSLNASSLAEFFNREAPAMRGLLPASFDDAFRMYLPKTPARVIDVNPVVAQGVTAERSFVPWAVAAVIAAALAFGWFGLRNRGDVTEPLPARPIGTSGIIAPPDLGRTMLPSVPTYRFDELRFETGSAALQPQSNAQLESIAAVLKAHPSVRVTVAGYTDNVGAAGANTKLSEARAATVRKRLIGMGVDADRVSTEGYGEASPVGDNSTEAGRAMNRRVSMLVTEK